MVSWWATKSSWMIQLPWRYLKEQSRQSKGEGEHIALIRSTLIAKWDFITNSFISDF